MRTTVTPLLLASCGASGPTAHPAPGDTRFWPELLDQARRHGISPLLHERLATLVPPASIPESIRDELARDYYTVAARNTVILDALARILMLFQGAKLPVLVLKGAVLAEKVYGNPALRSMADVDLLIHPQDLPRVAEMLTTMGYISPDLACIDLHDPTRGFLTTVVFLPRGGATIPFHVHWHWVNSSIPNRRLVERVSMNPVWRDAVATELAGHPATVMAPHHFLLHLAEHSLRVTHSLAKLRYLCDIHESVRHYGHRLDWDRLVEAARRSGLEAFTRIPLACAARLLGTAIPAQVLAALRAERPGLAERLFEGLTRRGLPPPGSSYLLHLAENQGLIEKTRFVFQTLFPPRQVLAQRSGILPSEVGSGHYLRRLADALTGGVGVAGRVRQRLPSRPSPGARHGG